MWKPTRWRGHGENGNCRGRKLSRRGAFANERALPQRRNDESFDKSPSKAKTGVASCSSFRFALDPDGEEYRELMKMPGKPIMDEYSVEEWLAVLEECPIQYKDPAWYTVYFR